LALEQAGSMRNPASNQFFSARGGCQPVSVLLPNDAAQAIGIGLAFHGISKDFKRF
jgi:hypothetical protein